jgi:hypothetical protein
MEKVSKVLARIVQAGHAWIWWRRLHLSAPPQMIANLALCKTRRGAKGESVRRWWGEGHTLKLYDQRETSNLYTLFNSQTSPRRRAIFGIYSGKISHASRAWYCHGITSEFSFGLCFPTWTSRDDNLLGSNAFELLQIRVELCERKK